jgi:membrane-bound metal-dependent hydrolase YbcI (DUF457 family)
MLAGHVAAGFLGKRIAPSLSLGTAVAAGLAADLLWGLFLIGGVESYEIVHPGRTIMTSEVVTHIDWSHSLALDLVWAVLIAGVYFWWRRDRRAAWVLAAAVLSHWLLDFASHKPDMPLAPGIPRYFGLGLWASIPGSLVVEGGLWVLAVVVYLRGTQAKGRAAHFVLWIGFALITLAWYNNIAGPPPALNYRTAGVASLTFFLLITAWAFWLNRWRAAARG